MPWYLNYKLGFHRFSNGFKIELLNVCLLIYKKV